MTAPARLADDPVERAGRRGAQIATLLFLLLSSTFVVSSTWQLARAVFFDEPPAPASQPASPGP